MNEVTPSIDQTIKYVTFYIGEELFGVHIEVVQQIISSPMMASVPCTPDYFLGILNLRGETISAIDLRTRFGLEKIPQNQDQRVIIVDFHHSRLGILVDSMGPVQNVRLGDVSPPPPLADPSTTEFLIGSVRISEESTLLLLDQELLLDPNDFTVEPINVRTDSTKQGGDMILAEPELVLIGFELNRELYVLNVADVEEIIQLPAVTKIPQTSHIIEGVFHLRNEVIPLIRLTRRLGIPDNEIPQDSSVLVVNLAGVKLGMVVGKIREVLRVKESNIEPLPNNVTGERAVHLRGIIQGEYNNEHVVHMVLLLDRLFEEDELQRLADFQLDEANQEEQAEEDHEEILYLLRFTIAQELYAIRLLQVNQITKLLPILSVPKAPPYVKGVMNVRGEIITVLDLPQMFSSPTTLEADKAKIIVIELGSQKVGLLVENVLGISNLSNRIFDLPDKWGQEDENQLVEAIGREEDGQVTVLLDLFATLHHGTQYEIMTHNSHHSTAPEHRLTA